MNEKVNCEKSRVAWFFILEKARDDKNRELAAHARLKLKELGCLIRYTKPETTHD